MNSRSGEIDHYLLVAVLVLTGFGLIMSFSAGGFMSGSSAKFSNDSLFFFKRELIRVALALVFFLVALNINYRKLRSLIVPFFGVMLVVLLLTLVLGQSVRGSRSWIMGLQPVEIARIALVLFLADFIDKKGEDFKKIKIGYIPGVAAVVLLAVIIGLQPDFGSAMALSILGYTMLFLGGANLLAWVGGLGLASVAFAAAALTQKHVLGRLTGFWWGLTRPEELSALIESSSGHIKNTLVQTHQSLLGIGSGGFFGVGLGQSRQKFLFVSEAHTDFIFSIIGEEGGLLFAGIIMLVFLVILWRGIKLSLQLSDRFESLTVLGLSCGIFIYAVINISVALGIFPITGLPLPFLSYGGSALLANAVSVGLILNISKHRGEKSGQTFIRKNNGVSDSRWRDGRSSLSWSGRSRRR
ncbi:MAG: putative lipid II flippase FtsW [Candidatus Edwardsbacteria bacterium]|nr:putative lipid II flippase FtsW [Candidatus Edwardsbacteria bacterium]